MTGAARRSAHRGAAMHHPRLPTLLGLGLVAVVAAGCAAGPAPIELLLRRVGAAP